MLRMSRVNVIETLPDQLIDHRAVQAWSQLQPERVVPENIEVLKLKKRKSAVYRLTGVGPNGVAVIAKRCRTTTASVERVIYETLLPRLSLPMLRCYGFVAEPEGEFSWLFLEDAVGDEYSPDDANHRALAGRWLGSVHLISRSPDAQALLPDRGPSHYLQLLRFARSGLLIHIDNPNLSGADIALLRTVVRQYDDIEMHWEELERFFKEMPRTLVHGDFVIKNIRIRPGTSGSELLVFDWEMSGWGVPATDLSAVGLCVRPDLETYGAVLRQDWPHLNTHDIRQLADYGNLLRLLDKIYWVMISMRGDTYEYLLKPLLTIRKYESQLTPTMQTLNWR